MELVLQESCKPNFPGGPGCCNVTKMVAKLIFLEDLSTSTQDFRVNQTDKSHVLYTEINIIFVSL